MACLTMNTFSHFNVSFFLSTNEGYDVLRCFLYAFERIYSEGSFKVYLNIFPILAFDNIISFPKFVYIILAPKSSSTEKKNVIVKQTTIPLSCGALSLSINLFFLDGWIVGKLSNETWKLFNLLCHVKNFLMKWIISSWIQLR